MLFQNNNIKHYSTADIKKYLNGELPAQEMNAMESAALDDPFLSDAMEGMKNQLKQMGSDDFDDDVNDLKKKLAEKIQKENKAIIIPRRPMWQRVAAVAAVLLGSTFLIYNFLLKNYSAKDKSISVAKEKMMTDSLTIPNSLAPSSKKDTAIVSDEVAINEKTKASKAYKKENAALSKRRSDGSRDQARSIEKNEENIKNKTVAELQTDNLKQIPSNPSPKAVDKVLEERAEGVSTGRKRAANDNLSNNSIEGKVIDENKNPVIGATIMIKGKKSGTNTDQYGNFKLSNIGGNDSTTNVVVYSVGFQSASATLSNNNLMSNEIQLKQSNQSLNEVVVVGYGISKKNKDEDDGDDELSPETNKEKEITFNALPTIGWHDYNDYINKNKNISTSDSAIKGKEIISFFVGKSNQLSSFKIKKSLSKTHDAEALRLIQQGPPWKLLKGKKEKITLAVEF